MENSEFAKYNGNLKILIVLIILNIMKTVKVQVYNVSKNPLPKYESNLAAGADVRVDFSRVTPNNYPKIQGDGEIVFAGEGHPKALIRLAPMSRVILPTGLYFGIPEGWEIQLRPRSGLSYKAGLSNANAVGTIDADYKDEVGIIAINLGQEDIWIEDGERCGQLVLKEAPQIEWELVNSREELKGEDRGGGFGHTNLDKNGNYITSK